MSTSEAKKAKAEKPAAAVGPISRKRKKTVGRKKRVAKLKTDATFAKAYHEGKSKRAADKKSAFRKKKSKKK
jgi:hypothetical protein